MVTTRNLWTSGNGRHQTHWDLVSSIWRPTGTPESIPGLRPAVGRWKKSRLVLHFAVNMKQALCHVTGLCSHRLQNPKPYHGSCVHYELRRSISNFFPTQNHSPTIHSWVVGFLELLLWPCGTNTHRDPITYFQTQQKELTLVICVSYQLHQYDWFP